MIDTFQIRADNQSALKVLKIPVSSNHSKHIDVVYHFARERVARRELEFSYISTHDMLADMFTKPVPGTTSCRSAVKALEWSETSARA